MITDRYLPNGRNRLLRRRLRELKMDGSLNKFIANFFSKAVRFGNSMAEEEILFNFTEGLSNPLKNEVAARNPKNLDEAEYLARQLYVGKIREIYEELNSNAVYIKNISKKERGKEMRTCHYCKRPGHIAKFCLQRKSDTQRLERITAIKNVYDNNNRIMNHENVNRFNG